MKLGKLKEVNIRKVWGHEQYGFSKWLSNEENINELGEILAKIALDKLKMGVDTDWRKLKPLYIQPPPVFGR